MIIYSQQKIKAVISVYEIIREFNEATKLAMNESGIFVLKRILPDDADMYRKLMTLGNRNVVRVYEVTALEDGIYAVQEFVQGMTLENHIKKNGLMQDAQMKDVVLQLCNGLEAVHALGIVHRDINPKNIMIDENGTVKIIDFGISRIKKSNQNTDTQFLGTQGFASPEQYGFTQTGFQSDIYSVGVLMNYLKTGCIPSEKTDSGTYAGVILKCTQMDMNNRYKDVTELVGDISKKEKWKNIIRSIPGFRKDVWWHKTIAIIYYVFLLTMVLFVTYKEGEHRLRNEILWRLTVLFLFAVPVPILTDFGGWLEKWSFTRNRVKSSKVFLQIFLSCVSGFIAALLISLVDS